ncbi:MAG TPA: transcriptional regulator [Verrucomicrobiales bacterium]|jgi:hypothetical protein|nr:transcriptional regulator [Verrucomicrobiales bacterium]HIL72063.1 transcriptional regulator [Verrucomicrobiota bacterium]
MSRKEYIDLLLNSPMTIREMSSYVGGKLKDIEQDLEHLFKSLKHTDYDPVIHVARCRKCGFEFSSKKLLKPSRCPSCRSSWLTDPSIEIRDGTKS